MLDLARVQKLHDAAIAAGLPGVLPKDYAVLKDHRHVWLEDPFGNDVPYVAAYAAVAWWLRGWCFVNDPHEDCGVRKVTGDPAGNYYLFWAEEIVANRKNQK